MYIFYNHTVLPEAEFNLSFHNRGLQYNDGLFDTLLFQNGKIRFLSDHLERMQQAMQVLSLGALPLLSDAACFAQIVKNLIQQNAFVAETTIRVKVNIWRKPGGLFTPELEEAEILISLQPQAIISKVIEQADFCTVIANRFTPFSFFKGPYALHYVQASLAKKKAALDEMILLDDKGHISETLVANIFWLKNNELFTPSLSSGCIAGIMRLNILRVSQMLNVPVWEGLFTKADLLSAETVFTSNVTGLRPVHHIANQAFSIQHPLVTQLENLVLA